jgi:hypothetical protein
VVGVVGAVIVGDGAVTTVVEATVSVVGSGSVASVAAVCERRTDVAVVVGNSRATGAVEVGVSLVTPASARDRPNRNAASASVNTSAATNRTATA